MHHLCVSLNTLILLLKQHQQFYYLHTYYNINYFKSIYTIVSNSTYIHYLLYISYYKNCKFSSSFLLFFDFSTILHDDDQLLKQYCPAHRIYVSSRKYSILGAHLPFDSFSFQQNLSRPHTAGALKQFC